MMSGRPLTEGGLSLDEIFTFTYDEGKTTTGHDAYLIPD